MKGLLAAISMHEPELLTFACGIETCLPELACSAVEFRGVTRNSLGGAVSSSTPKPAHVCPWISDIVGVIRVIL